MVNFLNPVAPAIGVDYTVGKTAHGTLHILLARGTDGKPTSPVLLEEGCTLQVQNLPIGAQEELSLNSTSTGHLEVDEGKWILVVDGVRTPLAAFCGLPGVVVRILATGTM